MLKLYDHLEEGQVFAEAGFGEQKFKYYASEIMEELGYEKADDIHSALHRAFQICRSLRIPVAKNFKQVFRHERHEIRADWKLSPLACYLIIMNGNPSNPNVAKAQLFLINHSEKS